MINNPKYEVELDDCSAFHNRPNAIHLHFGCTSIKVSGLRGECGDIAYYDFCSFVDKLEEMKKDIRENYFPHLTENSVRPSCEDPAWSNWEPAPESQSS